MLKRNLVLGLWVMMISPMTFGWSGEPDDPKTLRMMLRMNQQRQDDLSREMDRIRESLSQIRMSVEQASNEKEQVERRMQEAQGLSKEVMQEVEVSASTVPELIHRLESEKFTLEVERIGLETRVQAIAEAIREARDDDDNLSELADVELKLQQEQLGAMKKRYENLKDRLTRAKDQGVVSENNLQDQLLTYEAQLQSAMARRDASVLRAKMALANPPQVKELEGELRRATIELRVVEAKLSFVGKKLTGLRGTVSLAERILLLREQAVGRQAKWEAAMARGDLQIRELRRRSSDLEAERALLQGRQRKLEEALRDWQDADTDE
ncbi:MAG: hypothetical protein AAGF97_10195 [Planctomycetota bacterium]